MIIPGGYPCKLCGRIMRSTSEGRGFVAGKFKFVACVDCAPKVELATRATATIVQNGLAALVQHKAPGLMPILKQLHAAYVGAKQDSQHHES